MVGFAILYPFKCRMGITAPSRTGFRNLFECQLAASGPVSASPSPTTQRSEEHTLNSSHQIISYAVFCLKKKKKTAVRPGCIVTSYTSAGAGGTAGNCIQRVIGTRT